MSPVRVFVAASPDDEIYRDELAVHLNLMVRQGLLTLWHYGKIDPGQEIEVQFFENLEGADVILLLLSPSFFASDDCARQAARALERQRERTAIIVPVFVREINVKGDPLEKLQALPRSGLPLPIVKAERDKPWKEIAEELRQLAQRIIATKKPPPAGPDVALLPSGPGAPRIRVLFLAANPGLGGERREARPFGADAHEGGAARSTYSPLDLESEARVIEQAVRDSKQAAAFELKTAWAVRASELTARLKEFRPHVVHMSGHGEREGVVLLGDNGRPLSVPVKALGRLFELLRSDPNEATRVDVHLAVLNACWSAEQARELTASVGCAVGMRRSVEDDSAIAFAAAFYRQLAGGDTIRRAFAFAKNGLDLTRLPGSDIPQLFP
jgi:CHAT domain/TIR domain